MEQYFYLIWSLVFLVLWFALFLHRKDVRHEMFLISILFGFGGLVSEKVYLVDWWRPLTITHTGIGIEDLIIGFSIGGVASVIYEELYKRHLSKKKSKALYCADPFLFLFSFAICYLGLFYFFRFSSFYSSVITYLAFTTYVLLKRKDLIRASLLSGLWMLIIGIGVYFLLFLVYPGYIQQFWFLPRKWYADLVFGIPIGEYIWYFLTGAYIGPLYEFIKRTKVLKN